MVAATAVCACIPNETNRDTVEMVIANMRLPHCNDEYYEAQHEGGQDLCECCWAHSVTTNRSKVKASSKIPK